MAASAVSVLAALALIAAPAQAKSGQDVVRTDRGAVRGVQDATLTKYLGIPYAAPPVGDLRWKAPQPPERWAQVRDAAQYGPHCAQEASPFGVASTSEDCLYMNVYVPKQAKQSRHRGKRGGGDDDDDRGWRHRSRRKHKDLPVMVWIHGGGLTVGESDEYDPRRLVEQGVIVVTFNYRLGYLGFLAHPALTAESPQQSSGNYGLMDQQAALRWVQRNIERFGGDDDKVTIFGESAGGFSTHLHLASPLSRGRFDRAIAQSGAYSLDQPSLADAETSGMAVTHGLGCETQTAECLRSIPVADLLATQPDLPGQIGPNVDGYVLPQTVRAAFASGDFNRVPVIEGSTHDEFTLFIALSVEFVFGPVSEAFYPVAVNILVPTLGLSKSTADVLAEYPVTNYASPGSALSALGTDAVFACPGRQAAQLLSKHVRTYAYEFNDPNAPQLFVPPATFPYKAYHGSEVQYLFDIPDQQNAPDLNAEQRALADTMVRYWTRFASTGSPNAWKAPQWPRYTAATDTQQSLKPPAPAPATGFAADHHCAFWDAP